MIGSISQSVRPDIFCVRKVASILERHGSFADGVHPTLPTFLRARCGRYLGSRTGTALQGRDSAGRGICPRDQQLASSAIHQRRIRSPQQEQWGDRMRTSHAAIRLTPPHKSTAVAVLSAFGLRRANLRENQDRPGNNLGNVVDASPRPGASRTPAPRGAEPAERIPQRRDCCICTVCLAANTRGRSTSGLLPPSSQRLRIASGPPRAVHILASASAVITRTAWRPRPPDRAATPQLRS